MTQQRSGSNNPVVSQFEKAMAPHFSTLAWKIPWMEEPGRLQSMGSLRVGHDWASSLSLSCIGEGNGNPLQYSCLENPRDGGAWWAAVYGVAQSQTRLKRAAAAAVSQFVLISILPPLPLLSISFSMGYIGIIRVVHWSVSHATLYFIRKH